MSVSLNIIAAFVSLARVCTSALVRSLMTSQQIDKLRQLLLDCGIQTKTNKSSVLSEVASYMTQLEEQLADLEAERQR